MVEHISYADQNAWAAGGNDWQSPIAITDAIVQAHDFAEQPLTVTFSDAAALVADDRPVGEQFLGDGQLTIGGDTLAFDRIHFHDGSEHLVAGEQFAFEGHFVFQHPETKAVTVLGVLGQVGAGAAASDAVIQKLFAGDAVSANELNHLLPDKKSYLTYTGSLTTPPVQKDIRWVVLTEPLTVSAATAAVIHQSYPSNHRAVQPINGRTVHLYA